MTEINLREILVATARAYMGANTYNGQKQEIIDIYNKNQPRPRGYKVHIGYIVFSAQGTGDGVVVTKNEEIL